MGEEAVCKQEAKGTQIRLLLGRGQAPVLDQNQRAKGVFLLVYLLVWCKHRVFISKGLVEEILREQS